MTTPNDQDTLHASPPTIDIDGQTYTLRRLGVRDVFTVGRIASRGAAIALQEGTDLSNVSGEQAMMLFTVGLPYAEDDGMKLVAGLLGVTVKQLDDPTVFPADTLIRVAEALWDHQDVKAFFGSVQHLAGKLRTNTASPAPSAS